MTNCIFCESEYDKENEVCKNCRLSNQPRILVDWEIVKLLEMEIIKISPLLNVKEQLNPIGLDITLDTKFKKLIKSNNTFIDPVKPYLVPQYYEDVELLLSSNDSFTLHPGEFTLAQSLEYISIPDFIGAGLDGKSSLGRFSLTVHTTAGSVDPGFKGHITLELFNNGGLPLVLHPMQPVARLIFHLLSKSEKPYVGDYIGQTEVRPSLAYGSHFSQIINAQKDPIP